MPPKPISSGTAAMLANFSTAVEPVDVLAQLALHFAQLAPRSPACRRGTSRLPAGPCRSGPGSRRRPASRAWRAASCTSFSLAVSACSLSRKRSLGVAAQLVDQLEGPVADAAAAQRDQRVGARQVLQRAASTKARVVGVGDRHLLAQELAHLDPELVVEQIGVGDDDGVDLAGPSSCCLGRAGGSSASDRPSRWPWLALRRCLGGLALVLSGALSVPALSACSVLACLGVWRRRAWARRRGRRCWPRPRRAPPASALALRLVVAQQADRVGHHG